MFKNLPASQGAKRGIFTGKTALPSLIVHGLLIAGAVYATVKAPEAAKKKEEQVEFVDIKKQPEPPKPKVDQPKPETPPPPKGTQTLTPPTEPPPAIPAVDLSAPPVSAEDFSGVGTLGGTAKGEEPPKEEAPADPGFAYEVQQLDTKPALANAGQIQSVMERLYPRLLQDAGIGGTVMMQFVIQPDGSVDMSTVKVLDSPNDQLSDASMKAIEKFKFKPGKYKGEAVRVLIQMPITWQPAG